MQIVHVHVRVKPELTEEFKKATVENARKSIEEPGIARFDVVQDASDPARFVLMEVYRWPEAPAEHRRQHTIKPGVIRSQTLWPSRARASAIRVYFRSTKAEHDAV